MNEFEQNWNTVQELFVLKNIWIVENLVYFPQWYQKSLYIYIYIYISIFNTAIYHCYELPFLYVDVCTIYAYM